MIFFNYLNIPEMTKLIDNNSKSFIKPTALLLLNTIDILFQIFVTDNFLLVSPL